jgi:hypothetical protein
MTDQEIINQLHNEYGDQIVVTEDLPLSYCPGGINLVRAIYLGCDPTNLKYNIRFPFAFAHGAEGATFKQFIIMHSAQLNEIGLSWETVYTQNLCRNYFDKETGNNQKLWTKVAREFWIPIIKEELSIFKPSIPVLLTSQFLLEVLGDEETSKYTALDFYQCKRPIPVPASKNLLDRPLIPVYRGLNPKLKISYQLKNWKDYADLIKMIIK